MTAQTRSPLPMASTGCACCPPTPGPAQNAPAPSVEETSATASATYRVEGMTCGHCARTVTEALRALEGVRDVQLDLVPGGVSTVTVIGTADPEAARGAVEQAGYTLAKA